MQGLVELSQWHERYMVAFQYGSIVFFNFGDEEEEEALSAMRKFCTDEFRETRKDGIFFCAPLEQRPFVATILSNSCSTGDGIVVVWCHNSLVLQVLG